MNRFALAFREQQQLFLWDKTYLAGTLFKVGGCATLLAQFVVQFFYNPTVALILTLVLLGLLAGLLWLALRRDKGDWVLLPFCLIPAIFWGASLSDHALHFDDLIAALMAAGALAGYARIERRRLLWGSLLTLLLYVLAGPVALLFALCAWILDLVRMGAWGWKSILFALVAFLCGALAFALSAVPTWASALTPVFYYDLDAEMPSAHQVAWLSMPLTVLLALVAGKRGRSLPRRWLLAVIGAALALLCLFPAGMIQRRLESHEPLQAYELEHYVVREDWDGLIRACKRGEWTPGTANYLNMALAHKGALNDQLLKYDQRGVQSLLFLTQDNSMDPHVAQVMYAMGNMAAAQDVAFNLLSSTVGYCPEMLKMNARIDLMRGAYDVADKYLSLLEKAPHYKAWAQHYRSFLGDDAAVEADPELGPGRRSFPVEDGFALFESPLTELDRVMEVRPDHAGAMQYSLAFRLLAKDIEALTRFVDRFYGMETLQTLPVPVQEALIFYSDYSRNFAGVEPVSLDWCLTHGVTEETVRRFTAFQQESIQSGGAAPKGSQGTYWFYLLYKQI